jgi:large subunit ribosomal protein L9
MQGQGFAVDDRLQLQISLCPSFSKRGAHPHRGALFQIRRMTMKVILRADITNVGRQGDIKEVAPGYARNYLVPRRLAMEATAANLKIWDREKTRLQGIREQEINATRTVAERIAATPVTITVKVGDNGRLFGSVTAIHIWQSLSAAGFEIAKHSILLSGPIRELGTQQVGIRLHPEVIAQVTVTVAAEQEPGRETMVSETPETAQPQTSQE